MTDNEFRTKLKETLEIFDKRLSQLEHITNDVVIGSLKEAADEYAEEERFNNFHSNYGDKIAPLAEPYKKLFGEDYDLEKALYEDMKENPTEDEAACIEARIADLADRLAALKGEDKVEAVVEAVEPEAEVKVEEEEVKDDFPDEEQLAKEFDEAL